MISKEQVDPEPGERFMISAVSSLTGVRPMTLRAWERRYGLIKPGRTESGHRLYTRADVDLINEIVALLDRGLRIGQVQSELESRRELQPKTATGDLWDGYRRAMVSAIVCFDERRLDAGYNSALALYPIEEVTRRLLIPLLTELGERWENARGSIAEEHFFAFYLRNKLGARFHHRRHPPGGPKLLMACLPGEHHEIGLLLFALSAHDAGLPVVVLGSDLPLAEIPPVVKKADCKAVVLAGMAGADSWTLTEDLQALVQDVDVPVLVGGETSLQCCGEITRAGASVLGRDIDHALRRVHEAIAKDSEEAKA